MEILVVLSFAFNIVSILSVLKIPEFIQSIILKRIEKNISEKIAEEERDFQERLFELQKQKDIKLNELNLNFQKDLQKTQQDFTIKLSTLKRKYDVLPELYEKISIANGVVTQLDVVDDEEVISKETAKAHNFISFNRFYIPKDILDISSSYISDVINLALKLKNLRTSGYEKMYDEIYKETEELKVKLKEHDSKLVEAISVAINDQTPHKGL